MRIERATPEDYKTFLTEPYRPPSRGGNTKARHSHTLIIGGERYSFIAAGQRKWVFKGDTVSFNWDWDASKKYRNIAVETLHVWDKKGNRVDRGDPYTKRLRTAPTRLPVSRREQRD